VITVLVVDDHPVVQDGLSALIDTVEGMEVVARAASGREAVSEALSHYPDVVLMDLNMPGGSGIEATREIVSRCPGTRVLVLTLSEDDESIQQALRAGSRGYLLKGASQEEIVRGITTVATGGVLFSAAIAEQVLDSLNRDPRSGPPTVLPDLTTRERDILNLLAVGSKNNVIADALGISTKTVANHLSMIFTKLNVEDRAQAIIVARDAGLGTR
jgi:DNA-binding NarL/FixJ family response regulator